MSTEDRPLKLVAVEMIDADLPLPFVLRVFDLARRSEGVADLVRLWADAPDETERGEVEAELQGALEDREPAGARVKVSSFEAAEQLLIARRVFKRRLRQLVEERGGVSVVARRAEMPQPSLSRLLNSMSKPRPSTLRRLAIAMDLTVEDLMDC